jgi:hypothetical protein
MAITGKKIDQVIIDEIISGSSWMDNNASIRDQINNAVRVASNSIQSKEYVTDGTYSTPKYKYQDTGVNWKTDKWSDSYHESDYEGGIESAFGEMVLKEEKKPNLYDVSEKANLAAENIDNLYDRISALEKIIKKEREKAEAREADIEARFEARLQEMAHRIELLNVDFGRF